MNCKPGDLARVVKIDSSNYGKIVRCVELFPNGNAPAWVVDPQLADDDDLIFVAVWDTNLRPIADPGDEERDERDILVKPPVPVAA